MSTPTGLFHSVSFSFQLATLAHVVTGRLDLIEPDLVFSKDNSNSERGRPKRLSIHPAIPAEHLRAPFQLLIPQFVNRSRFDASHPPIQINPSPPIMKT